jgi:autotransporter-associated beta strand protein
VWTNAAGEYVIVPPGDGDFTLTASKGGHVSGSIPATMAGAAVGGLDIALEKSAGLDPLVLLDASTLATGDDLASWPNTGSLGGSFNRDAVGPNVVADIAGRQAVEFIQPSAEGAYRRTMVSGIPVPSEITGASDWTISTDLYKADLANVPITFGTGDNCYMSWAGRDWGTGQTAQFSYVNNLAYVHYGSDRGFNTVPSGGAWHNVTITYDGSSEKVYVDGVIDSTETRVLNLHPGDMMMVGAAYWRNARGEDQYWRYNGAIAKLQIFDQALTEAEVALLNGIAPPDTYEWAGPNNGLWSDVANWVSAVPVSGKIAVFSNSASAGATVDIDAPAAAGGIQFNGQVANQLLKSSTASPLTLDNAAAAAPITVTGSHTISADINAPKNLSVSGPGSATLTLSGTIATGTSGAWDEELIKGPNLVLNGTASWTSTGAHYMTVGSPTGATLTINDSATIDWTDSWSLFVAWNAGDTGKIVQNGGTVKTQPVGTAWYNNNGPGVQLGGAADPVTAEYDLNGGILITPNVYNVNGKPVTLPSGSAIFRFNGGVLQATQNDNVDDPSVVAEGTTHLMGNLTHAYVGTNGAKIDTATFNCGMDQVLEHDPGASPVDGGLTKLGLGTLTLLRDSSYTGPTQVQDGVLACATIASLAPTALEIASAATLELSYTGTQTVPSLKIGGVTKPAGVYDAANTDGHITGTGTVTVVAASPYGTWIAGYPSLSGANALPGADPDGDGMTNQDEFAFGLNPTLGSSVNPITKQLNKTTGQFSYTRLSTSGLAYTVWTSENLVAWTKDTGATQAAGTPDGNGVQTVVVTLGAAKPLTTAKLFVRVEAN